MEEIPGTPIPSDEAWRMFDQWRAASTEVGVLFMGTAGSFTTTGTVTSSRAGRLQLNSATTEVTFKLKDASFRYGPVQLFPRWPYPPPVEVIAIQAYLASGDWIVLAEGLRPKSVPSAIGHVGS
jgi:hypothetical protein